MTRLKRSSALAEFGESAPVQLQMPLQARLLLPPVMVRDPPSCWKELVPSGTFTRCKDDNKLACCNQPSVCERLCNTLLGILGSEQVLLFYSILFYSILFYSILFYSILFYSILFYSPVHN